MARALLTKRTLQGQALSSFDAFACLPGRYLVHEIKPARRCSAELGSPVERW
jgi:hypothetical protein